MQKPKRYLQKGDRKYLIVQVRKDDDIIVLEKACGMRFESHISKIRGYKIVVGEE